MYNSMETEQLQRLIDKKRAQLVQLAKLDRNSQAVKSLNEELTFLSDVIMPLLLMRTTVYYNELSRQTAQSFRKLERVAERCNYTPHGLLIYHEFRKPRADEIKAIVAVDSNRYLFDTGIDLKINLYAKQTTKIEMQDFKGWENTII